MTPRRGDVFDVNPDEPDSESKDKLSPSDKEDEEKKNNSNLPEGPEERPQEGESLPVEPEGNENVEDNFPQAPNDLPGKQRQPDILNPDGGPKFGNNEHPGSPSNNDYSGKAYTRIPSPIDNEKNRSNYNHNYSKSPNNNGPEDRVARPHKVETNTESPRDSYNANPEYDETRESPNYEQREDNGKRSSNNNYKIAGGIIGGLALIGCAGFAYNFISHGAASGLTPENAPFDDAVPEEDKDLTENDQFKLPEDNDWN
ncbi:thrombospondin-related anonymous protein, putative [Plasmodium malariae]|uniref:Thrombospondin-related anonymous protein, putative n=1 Tax=Plasmodium malariae TaxID=5858 RepID=A0A1C3L0K8_PLAMA|nr:thrombospondin-related anonymous protein, putative [Plasmodium malariae]